MTPIQVRKLVSLAEHGKTRDITIYAQACRKLDDLETQIKMLNADKRKHVLSSGGDFNALARWQHWVVVAINKLQSQHHEAAAKNEVARLSAVKSAAKVQALEILLKKALKEEVLIKRRRAEQNGQPPDA